MNTIELDVTLSLIELNRFPIIETSSIDAEIATIKKKCQQYYILGINDALKEVIDHLLASLLQNHNIKIKSTQLLTDLFMSSIKGALDHVNKEKEREIEKEIERLMEDLNFNDSNKVIN